MGGRVNFGLMLISVYQISCLTQPETADSCRGADDIRSTAIKGRLVTAPTFSCSNLLIWSLLCQKPCPNLPRNPRMNSMTAKILKTVIGSIDRANCLRRSNGLRGEAYWLAADGLYCIRRTNKGTKGWGLEVTARKYVLRVTPATT